MIPGGIGYLELLLLFALILVLFGPDRLPGIARKMGQLTEQLRKAAALFQHNLLAMEEDTHSQDADDTDSSSEDYGVAEDDDWPDADAPDSSSEDYGVAEDDDVPHDADSAPETTHGAAEEAKDLPDADAAVVPSTAHGAEEENEDRPTR